MKKEYFLGLGIVVLVALAGGYFFLRAKTAETPAGNTASTTAATAISGAGYTIEAVPADIRSIMPSLTRTVQYGANVPPQVKATVEKNIADITARLKTDPTQVADWLNLGVMYHAVNDYKGAEEVWLFLTKVLPKNTTAYDNLGKLYSLDLREFPKAESYLKQSMAIAPTSTTPYMELYTLYRYSYKTNTTAAADILKAWANAIPGSIDPYITLGLYYRDQGKLAEAKAALTTAMNMARKAGNVDAMGQIGPELSKLSQ